MYTCITRTHTTHARTRTLTQIYVHMHCINTHIKTGTHRYTLQCWHIHARKCWLTESWKHVHTREVMAAVQLWSIYPWFSLSHSLYISLAPSFSLSLPFSPTTTNKHAVLLAPILPPEAQPCPTSYLPRWRETGCSGPSSLGDYPSNKGVSIPRGEESRVGDAGKCSAWCVYPPE